MKTGWKVTQSVVIALAILVITGCSEYVKVHEYEKKSVDTEDIIAMSKAGVASEVIILKIKVSQSQFSLDTNDIIRLKNEEVSDDVIGAMIDTDIAAEEVDRERSYALYDYWFNYYNTFYPVYRYNYPIFPYLYDSWGPSGTPLYRWSGTLGRYYMDFPVGLPRRVYGKGRINLRGYIDQNDEMKE
jgi:hypothetical protein